MGRLDTSTTFERIFGLYTQQFGVLIPAALAIFVPIALLDALVLVSGSFILVFASIAIAMVGRALYVGVVVQGVADMRDGRRDFAVGDLLRAASPYIWPLVGAGILFGLAVALGLILLIVPGLIVLTWGCLFPAVIVIERADVMASFSRSRELVRGNAWRVFGVIVVTFLIVVIVGEIFTRLAIGISDTWPSIVVGSAIGNVLTAPLWGISVSVLYFELRDLQQGTQGLYGTSPPPPVTPA